MNSFVHRSRQRGVALITALFVVALAVIAGVAMFEVSNLAVHRTANMALSEAAWWYADGVESWTKSILQEDLKLNNTDSFADIWAIPEVVLPIDNGAIRGHIEDLQGRFNLNNLGLVDDNQAKLYLAQFQRLIDSLPNFDPSKSVGVGDAVRDWITTSTDRTGLNGAKDADYLGNVPPYRIAAQPMVSISELLLVKGMTPELFAALKPYVAALPQTGTKINVNTALEPVLRSLAPDIDQTKLARFLVLRKSSTLKDTSALFGVGEIGFLPVATGTGIQGGATAGQSVAQLIGVSSSFFELEAEVVVGSGRVALYSVFSRGTSGTPVVIAHSTDTE